MSTEIAAPSRSYPFGRDVDTLILCHNTVHRDQVIRALKIKARYEVFLFSTRGLRFEKIIVFRPRIWSSAEDIRYERYINEDLQCRLSPTGELYVI